MKKSLGFLLVSGLVVTSACSSSQTPTETPQAAVKPSEDTVLVDEAITYQAPYNRIAGYALETKEPNKGVPVAVWVDFDPQTDTVLKVHVVGDGNPYLDDNVEDLLDEYGDDLHEYKGLKATDFKNDGSALNQAIYQASQSYLKTKDQLIIRPYQSMMTRRYLANNPYIVSNDALSGEVEVNTEIVAVYPNDALMLVEDDVKSGEDVKFSGGKSIAPFSNDSGEYSVVSGVVIANKPGIAVIKYSYNGLEVYDAVDIYENFTLELSGSDAYGLVVDSDDDDNVVTYSVLGDKAMNFPGGTCGSTVIDVSIDTTSNTIKAVNVVEHSDSTYLANPWEYNGGFVNTGDFIYNIDAYCNKFVGVSTDNDIVPFVVASKENLDGGFVVDGGINMVVSGATRTSNAIIYAVNAALDAYRAN